MSAPKGWSRLITPLTTEYWSSRPDVWLILGALETPSSITIREVAFDLLLKADPRRFISAAIEETQDFGPVKDEVLKALGAVARTKGPAMAAAVRHAVSTTDTGRLRRLISDFSASNGPLTRVAEDLWPTRLWLAFLQFLSNFRS